MQAPANFRQCMISIVSDMIEDYHELFMDDFFVFGSSSESYLTYLGAVLEQCQ